MEKYFEKAAVLLEALPYIQKFQGKCVVVKLGGSLMSEQDFINSILKNVVFMRLVGICPLIVHGGGVAINETLKSKNILSKFVDGIRVTDAQSIDIVRTVLVDKINKALVEKLKTLGVDAVGMEDFGEGLITVSQAKSLRNAQGDFESLGYVGDVRQIDVDRLKVFFAKSQIPVIAPLGKDANGELYNINADSVAGELASFLNAEKLIYLTDIDGVFMDKSDSNTLLSSLLSRDVQKLIDASVIEGGMLPKVKSCVKALHNGARKGHIVSGYLQNSLLLEIFTDRGVGTEIVS